MASVKFHFCKIRKSSKIQIIKIKKKVGVTWEGISPIHFYHLFTCWIGRRSFIGNSHLFFIMIIWIMLILQKYNFTVASYITINKTKQNIGKLFTYFPYLLKKTCLARLFEILGRSWEPCRLPLYSIKFIKKWIHNSEKKAQDNTDNIV